MEKLSKFTGWTICPKKRKANNHLILQDVASYDLWICHAFFGTPGSLDDINLHHRSPFFNDMLAGRSSKVSVVNGYENDKAYYLTGRSL